MPTNKPFSSSSRPASYKSSSSTATLATMLPGDSYAESCVLQYHQDQFHSGSGRQGLAPDVLSIQHSSQPWASHDARAFVGPLPHHSFRKPHIAATTVNRFRSLRAAARECNPWCPSAGSQDVRNLWGEGHRMQRWTRAACLRLLAPLRDPPPRVLRPLSPLLPWMARRLRQKWATDFPHSLLRPNPRSHPSGVATPLAATQTETCSEFLEGGRARCGAWGWGWSCFCLPYWGQGVECLRRPSHHFVLDASVHESRGAFLSPSIPSRCWCNAITKMGGGAMRQCRKLKGLRRGLCLSPQLMCGSRCGPRNGAQDKPRRHGARRAAVCRLADTVATRVREWAPFGGPRGRRAGRRPGAHVCVCASSGLVQRRRD